MIEIEMAPTGRTYIKINGQIIYGSFVLLGEPQETLTHSSGEVKNEYTDDPIGVVFVPCLGQEVAK